MAFRLERIDEVVGLKLLDIEHNQAARSGSGVEEVVLNFENGKELLIYQHEDGTICVEGD